MFLTHLLNAPNYSKKIIYFYEKAKPRVYFGGNRYFKSFNEISR
jgi:hypothetical protein